MAEKLCNHCHKGIQKGEETKYCKDCGNIIHKKFCNNNCGVY